MSTNAAVGSSGNEAMPTSYPDLDATSPTDSVIAGDFGTLSAAEQVWCNLRWAVTKNLTIILI